MKQLKANDYVSLTRNYLKNYTYYAQYINNVYESVKDIDRQLADESIKTMDYTGNTRGGTKELTAVESAASRRILLEEEKRKLLSDALFVEAVVSRVSNTLLRLNPEEQGLLRGFYFDRLGYQAIARKYAYTERWCRVLIRRAESKMALMLFGPKATDPINFISTNA